MRGWDAGGGEEAEWLTVIDRSEFLVCQASMLLAYVYLLNLNINPQKRNGMEWR
jgi:hypothetical protein